MRGTPHHGGRHFAERTLSGLDDAGRREEVCIWIDWLPGGVWGVGRAVDLGARENPALVREDDWIFRGYEMQDALAAANDALSADLDVCREIGALPDAAPFSESELRPPLERWFLSH